MARQKLKKYRMAVGICGPTVLYTNIIKAYSPEDAARKYLGEGVAEGGINEITDGKSLKKVGIVGNSLITHSVYADFVQSLKKVGAPTVESADLLVSKCPQRKRPALHQQFHPSKLVIHSKTPHACLHHKYDCPHYHRRQLSPSS